MRGEDDGPGVLCSVLSLQDNPGLVCVPLSSSQRSSIQSYSGPTAQCQESCAPGSYLTSSGTSRVCLCVCIHALRVSRFVWGLEYMDQGLDLSV